MSESKVYINRVAAPRFCKLERPSRVVLFLWQPNCMEGHAYHIIARSLFLLVLISRKTHRSSITIAANHWHVVVATHAHSLRVGPRTILPAVFGLSNSSRLTYISFSNFSHMSLVLPASPVYSVHSQLSLLMVFSMYCAQAPCPKYYSSIAFTFAQNIHRSHLKILIIC